MQAYVEQSDMDIVIAHEQRTTLDIEYQQQQRLGERVDFMWGTGWRHKRDEVVGGAPRSPPGTKAHVTRPTCSPCSRRASSSSYPSAGR